MHNVRRRGFNRTEAYIVVVQAVVNTRCSGNKGTNGVGRRVGESTELWSSAGRSDNYTQQKTIQWDDDERTRGTYNK